MAIDLVYPSLWGVGEMLTSAQMNALQSAITYALDKRAGYADSLSSIVALQGAGRIISSIATGPDADISFSAGGGNQIIRVPTLTAARAYTLSNSGATMGDRLLAYIEGTGMTPSGYVEVRNDSGTGIFRLGMMRAQDSGDYAQGDAAEFIFNGTEWMLMRGTGGGLRTVEFLTDGVWICPPGVNKVILTGCGGGGGGGGGRANSTSANRWIAGGGGGGGALLNTVVWKVVPGTAYQILIGAGGTGSGAGFDGTNGSDTTFSPLPDGLAASAELIASFAGAQGGRVQVSTYGISSAGLYRAHGGAPVASTAFRGWGNFANDTVLDAVPSGISSFGSTIPFASGGDGNGTGQGTVGLANPFGRYTGGTGGAKGSDSGNERGGGGGGGGGAGPFGNGANGGAGGNGAGFAGSGGSSAAANTGAGGGGGGSGGTAGAGSGAGGNGGSGGSGRLIIAYFT